MYIQHDSISCAPLGLEDAGIEVSRLRRRPRSGRITRRQKPANALVLVAVPGRRWLGWVRYAEARWGRYTDRPRSVALTLNLPALARDSVCQRIVASCRPSISMSVGLAEPG